MQHSPAHWSEGLFLSAQHFQAADRHWHESLFQSCRYDQAYFYGLREIQFSADAISNFSFQVNACEGRTRRGTMVSFGEGAEPDRVSVKHAIDEAARRLLKAGLAEQLKSTDVVRIFLAIPKLRIGNANVGPPGDREPHRFRALTPLPLQDENTGGNDQEVGFRKLNVQLFCKVPSAGKEERVGQRPAELDDHPDFELLPVAQVRRGGEAGPVLDDGYIPPVLALDAWPPLQTGILQAIYDRIGNRIERLSAQVIARQTTLASPDPGDLERLLLLMRLNEAFSTLSVLVFARGVYPFLTYWLLAHFVGQLCIFDKSTRRPPEIPKYDHEDLGYIFRWMKDKIDYYLNLIQPGPEPQYRPFVGGGMGMQVTLDEEWLGKGFRWLVGVQHGTGTAEECRKILAPNYLHWKLGSLGQVDTLFSKGQPGLALKPSLQIPKELPTAGWIYFDVTRAGDAWNNVVASRTLAMRYKDELVDNKDSFEGQQTLVIKIQPGNLRMPLQFGLWAVPIIS